MRILSSLLLLSVIASPCVALAQDAPPTVREIIERWRTDDADIRSFYATPFSEKRASRTSSLADRIEAEVVPLLLDDALTRDERIDVVLLTDHLQQARAQDAWNREQDARAAPLLPFAADLVALEVARRALEPVDPREAAGTLQSAKDAIEALRKRIEKKPDDADALTAAPHIALRAARSVDAVKRALKDWFDYRNGYEPEFGWWVRKPHAQLDHALGEYAKLLREKVAGQKGPNPPLVGEPLGPEALAGGLRHERIPYSAAELIALAEQHMEWCDAEGRKAAQEMGLGDDWHAAVEKVKGDNVPPGEMDDLVEAQSRAAIEFVTSRKLVHVPELCNELWRLDMISEQGQKTLPFAAYSGNRMLVAYPTEGMAHDTKEMSLRGNNRHFSHIVVPHELIPGHHLQGFYAARHNTHRAPFRTPFLVEGWSLYWEMRLWEEGWAGGPEDRIGMLFWRKHRCARVILSLRYHLGEMSTKEMIDYLTSRIGLEVDGATAEVRRWVGGGYGPLYQAAYLIGGLQLRALHREAVESGRMTEEFFHELVLRQNSIPIDLIRARVLELPVDGAPPSWRFAD